MSLHRPLRSVVRALLGATALALALGPPSASADAVRTAHVEAELVAADNALVPGGRTTLALRLKLAPGWHTYWLNPGDSGLPTTLAWTLPEGVAAGPIQWPAPKALPAGPLLNYGYEDEVLHLVDRAGRARACCRRAGDPQGPRRLARLQGDLHPRRRGSRADAARGEHGFARRALERPDCGHAGRASAPVAGLARRCAGRGHAHQADDDAGRRNGKAAGTLRFFPFEADRIEPSAPQQVGSDGATREIVLPVSSAFAGRYERVAGVLTASDGLGSGASEVKAAVIDVPLSGTIAAGARPATPTASLDLAPAASPTTSGNGISLALALLFALGGGVLLNLMPCVFPVLSIKVLGFARHHDSKATMRAEAMAFASGVLLTFLALGFVLFGLRAAGEQLGWGFQLQSPGVVTVLALLFFALALNLSGVFEFGQFAPSGVAGWTSRNRTLDAFGSGVLAVVIASPCTAPFMGAALGFALAGTALTTLLVFGALGVGMALPFALLAWFPAWRRRLPRSGPWLAHFKQLLAFPLYATVIWLAWVLGAQRDNDAVVRLLFALLALGFVLWTWRIVRGGGPRGWMIAGVAALAAGVVVAAPLFAGEGEPAARTARLSDSGGWDAYTPAKVSELQAAGRTVFVDFTAAWCVTCQVNKRLVLETADTRAAFARSGVALLRADWTRRDAVITEALARLGRNGVPAYVVYRPGQPPQLLPEILSRQVVLDAIRPTPTIAVREASLPNSEPIK